MLPQEVGRQRIQMTGVKEKEDPYWKCIEREWSSERLEEERRVESHCKGKEVERENNKCWSQNSGQRVKVSHARSLWR